jgi:phosphatidylglycerophosphate synthase
MFDVQLRRLVDPALDRIAVAVARTGTSANAITIIGALVGLGAALTIASGSFLVGLALVIVNRIMDGLDGTIARRNGATAWGGYLDSIADYGFYIAVPIGFAFADPANLWPALLLVSSFTLTAVSFLALAAIMAGRDLGHGDKAFTYSTGLMEGGETIGFFIIMCLLPQQFPMLASFFAVLCVVTVGQRMLSAHRLLR